MTFTLASKICIAICCFMFGVELVAAARGQLPVWAPVLFGLFTVASVWLGYKSKEWW